MSGGENPIGQLVSAIFVAIVGLTLFQVLGGTAPGDTLLIQVTNSSELVIKVLIALVIGGVIVGLMVE